MARLRIASTLTCALLALGAWAVPAWAGSGGGSVAPSGGAAPSLSVTGGGALVLQHGTRGMARAHVKDVFSRVLRSGARGSDVKKLQTWLNYLGYKVASSGV